MSYTGYGGSLGYNRYLNSSNQKCCCPGGSSSGSKGDKGPQGPQGPKGDIGPQGPTGPQGPIGPQGQKGEKGLIDASGTFYSDYIYWDTTGASWEVGSTKVHIGKNAGASNQGDNSVAIGKVAGQNDQSGNAVAIGVNAGRYSQEYSAVAVGGSAGENNQSRNAIAIGNAAGQSDQSGNAIAIGNSAGNSSQGNNSIAIGNNAGVSDQSNNSIIINASSKIQDASANQIVLNASNSAINTNVLSGCYISPIRQESQIYSLYYDENTKEITYDVSGGSTLPSGTTRSEYLYWETSSGSWEVDGDKIHIGTSAGANQQAYNAIAIGKNAGASQQSINSIAIGENAGKNQGDLPYSAVSDMIAIGGNAGQMQGAGCVALGGGAGTYQTAQDIAIGLSAGQNQGGTTTTSNRPGSGGNNIAIGSRAGNTQDKNCIAIGFDSGYKQGDNCIAIGYRSGISYPVANSNQANNSIILNATGNFYNAANSGFFVIPITNASKNNILYYDDTTGEITYDSSGQVIASGLKLDFTNFDVSQNKVLVADGESGRVTTQDAYGIVECYTALRNISNGAPIVTEISGTILYADTIQSIPGKEQIIGIALEDKNMGEDIRVLQYGYCSARYDSSTDISSVSLNNITTGNTYALNGTYNFTDSGGAGGGYLPNENYLITFDLGDGILGNIDISINSIDFEHSGTLTNPIMYDRLGIQTSIDGITFTNASINGLYQPAITTPPWGQSAGTPETPGCIFPRSFTTYQALYNTIVPPPAPAPNLITLTNIRAIRFYFSSDSSVNLSGWDLDVTGNSANNIAVNQKLYVSTNDPTKITKLSNSGIEIGYAVTTNYGTSGDNVMLRLQNTR